MEQSPNKKKKIIMMTPEQRKEYYLTEIKKFLKERDEREEHSNGLERAWKHMNESKGWK